MVGLIIAAFLMAWAWWLGTEGVCKSVLEHYADL